MANIPIYKQIQQKLKEHITSGVYEEETMLPSENELCTTFGATRMTIRQALGELVKEGYITRHHGRGSKVAAIRKSLGLLSLKGWTEIVGASQRHGTTQVILGPTIAEVDKNELIYFDNDVQTTQFIYLKRLRIADGVPVMVEQTFIPKDGLESFCEEPLVDGSVFKTLFIRHQIDVVGMIQEVRAIASNQENAQLLGIEINKPVLHLSRKYHTNKDGFFLYSSTYCNTDKFAISGFN